MTAALEKLDRLRDLAPDEAREVEGLWPLTLAELRAGADDDAPILGRSVGFMRRLLLVELDERLAAQAEVAPA